MAYVVVRIVGSVSSKMRSNIEPVAAADRRQRKRLAGRHTDRRQALPVVGGLAGSAGSGDDRSPGPPATPVTADPGVPARALQSGVGDGGGPGGEDDDPGADDEAQPVGDQYGQRRADAVPEAGVQQGRVESIATEQRRVHAVDGGSQDPGHGAVGDAPAGNERSVAVGRAALPREGAGDDDDGSQKNDEHDGATADEMDDQLARQQTGSDERAPLIGRSVADHCHTVVTADKCLPQTIGLLTAFSTSLTV